MKKKGWVVTAPKTEAGNRVVHLPKIVSDALSDHLELFVSPAPDALAFTGFKGGPLSTKTLYDQWRTACGKVGLDKTYTFHDLRHTAGTMAAHAGGTTRELMARMGHASHAASLKYQHAAERRDADLATNIDTAITAALEHSAAEIADLPRDVRAMGSGVSSAGSLGAWTLSRTGTRPV